MQTKLKRKNQFGEESIEAKPQSRVSEPTTFSDEAKALWENMLKNTRQDLVEGSVTSVAEQIIGTSKPSPEDYLIEGNVVSLDKYKQARLDSARQAKQEKAQEEKPQITAEFMEYKRTVVNAERTGETKTEMEVKRAVDEIRAEIRKLTQTSKLVERTVKDATADQAPIRPGKYHLSFFEFVLGVIRDATRKLEDTVHFGAVFTSKKQQSKYWNSYKRHGTQFGLSGERTTATQTG